MAVRLKDEEQNYLPKDMGELELDRDPDHLSNMLKDLGSQESMSMNGKTCLICFDKDSNAIFMDCGHGGVCYDCAMEIWKSSNECHLCREPI